MSAPPTLHVSQHPAVLHKLAILRDERVEPKKFREIVRELSWLLGYEALADARVRPLTVRTPLEETQAHELGERIGLVPILRAGLGMVQPFQDIFPDVSIGYVGLERDHTTAIARSYYCKLPPLDGKRVVVVDPMLATGGSAAQAVEVVKSAGAKEIVFVCIVAAPEGVATFSKAHPEVAIHAGVLDRELNAKKYILPGLGDFGDRLYGT